MSARERKCNNANDFERTLRILSALLLSYLHTFSIINFKLDPRESDRRLMKLNRTRRVYVLYRAIERKEKKK